MFDYLSFEWICVRNLEELDNKSLYQHKKGDAMMGKT